MYNKETKGLKTIPAEHQIYPTASYMYMCPLHIDMIDCVYFNAN